MSDDKSVYDGISIQLPAFPDRSSEAYYKPSRIINPETDYQDIVSVDKSIESVRGAMFKVNAALQHVERKTVIAETRYEREFNRAFLKAEGKTAELKRCIAHIQTESYENEVLVCQQMSKELARTARTLSQELEALKTMSYNIRKGSDL